MLMTRTEKKLKYHENHLNPRKNQQEKTEKNKILQKEIPLEITMTLNEIEEESLQNICRKYKLID